MDDLKHSCESRKLGCNRLDANATVDDSVMFKLGNALSGILHVQDVHLGCISLSVESKLPQGFNIQHSKRLNVTTTQEKSNYYGPSSCSEEKASNLVSLDEKDEVPDTESENLSAECPISLPTFTKPVSAMKGSREKVGIPLKKLSVTWAPDVYDPPCNSISHMVKSHSSQRSRNKKDSKHRHKGKSSQGSNSSKRYKKHAGKTDYRLKSSPTSVRLSYPSSARLLYGDYNQTKFGSSFLRTSLAEVHVTVAEAT